jgi:hypothetical protein
LLNTFGSLAGAGEVVAGVQGVGMIGAQNPLVVCEDPLAQAEGVPDSPGIAVGTGEIVAGFKGVEVVWAQNPLPVGHQPLGEVEGLLDSPGIAV